MSKKASLAVVFVIVFIDLAGFGMILPLSTYLAESLGASGFEIGLLMTIYSLMQFLFAPIWGKLSDRYGRRPILLMSLFFSSISYLGFAFADQLWLLFFWRALAGLFAANISTAIAYIADLTDENQRSKNMGLIGAAFGLGFMIGPFLGGVFGDLGEAISPEPPFGINFSALIAAAITMTNFLVALKVLKESLSLENRRQKERGGRLKKIFAKLSRPVFGPLLSISFISSFAMAHMESTVFLFVMKKFDWSLGFTSYGFAYIGLMMAITQGYLIRKWMPVFGERKLLGNGLLISAIGLSGIVYATGVATMILAMTILSLGLGMLNPSLLGSISLLSDKTEQGEVMGVLQSLSSLGRILGPALGGFYYDQIGPNSPFFFASLSMVLGFLIILRVYKKIPEKGKSPQAA